MKVVLTINESEVSEGVMKTGGVVENLRVFFNEIDDNFGNVDVEEVN